MPPNADSTPLVTGSQPVAHTHVRARPHLLVPQDNSPLLSVENLTVEFGSRGLFASSKAPMRAVDNLSFTLHKGETLGLVGESGCGKSTLSRAILGLIKPHAGQVLLSGHDIHKASASTLKRLRQSTQMIFQDPAGSMNPRMRISDIVAEPLIIHGLPYQGVIEPLLERCGMPAACMTRFPHEFSGGQRQRIAIARALALRPALVICDEPTSALDVSVQAQILNLLLDLQREFQMSYLFISHDIGVVSHVSTRIAVMKSGRIVEIGQAQEIIQTPQDPYTRQLLAAAGVYRAQPPHARSLA